MMSIGTMLITSISMVIVIISIGNMVIITTSASMVIITMSISMVVITMRYALKRFLRDYLGNFLDDDSQNLMNIILDTGEIDKRCIVWS